MGLGSGMYAGNIERKTLDGEWTISELEDDVDDECLKLVPVLADKYKNRAVYDKDLFKWQYVAEKIKSETDDLIEVYNKEYDRHRDEKLFGIVHFDNWIKKRIERIMNSNLVGAGKK